MDIVAEANKFLDQCNIKIRAIQDKEIPSIAYYDPNDNVFRLNLNKIIKTSKKIETDLSDYLIIFMSHEIGHYLDQERISIQSKINSLLDEIKKGNWSLDLENRLITLHENLEENADKIGLRFVPGNLIGQYNKVNIRNMEVTTFDFIRKIDSYKFVAEKEKLIKHIIDLHEELKKVLKKYLS